jgi:hypothetical protein
MMIPHEPSIPFPMIWSDGHIGLKGIGDIVRVGKVKVLGQVDGLEGIDHFGFLR